MPVATTEKKKHRQPIDLSGAHIPGTDLSNAYLAGANFSEANLAEMNFEGAILRQANLSHAKLVGANLAFADLSFTDLSSSDLSGADLRSANLSQANFSHANLRNTCLKETDLRTAKELTWDTLLDARFDETTLIPEYLSEDKLFKYLEILNPNFGWRGTYTGRVGDLLAELRKIFENTKSSLNDWTIKRLIREIPFSQEQDLED